MGPSRGDKAAGAQAGSLCRPDRRSGKSSGTPRAGMAGGNRALEGGNGGSCPRGCGDWVNPTLCCMGSGVPPGRGERMGLGHSFTPQVPLQVGENLLFPPPPAFSSLNREKINKIHPWSLKRPHISHSACWGCPPGQTDPLLGFGHLSGAAKWPNSCSRAGRDEAAGTPLPREAFHGDIIARMTGSLLEQQTPPDLF